MSPLTVMRNLFGGLEESTMVLPEREDPATLVVDKDTDSPARESLCATCLPSESVAGASYYWGKRVFDVTIASLALIVLAPLFMLVAVLIKLCCPGPVFFSQERVGSRRRNRGGQIVWEVRTFSFYKFRSMRTDADSSLHRHYIRQFCEGVAAHHGTEGSTFKLKDDPRVTRIGRIIRKTSIDELPQLVNVLKGDMSLVGPRPLPVYEVAYHKTEYLRRLAGLGGITGVWQVRGRGRVPMEEMMRMDIEYVSSPSLWLDLKLLFLTVPCLIPKRGAE